MIDQSALSAALGGRYQLTRELGAGGMATVFLAHDSKHGRDVAIKVLNPELTQSLTAERFLREIGITARLNHPHILPLLDSGTAGDGTYLYYVMPVATGESLRDKLARDGAMPVRDAVHYATEIAEALVAAHAIGVVHRDIKPDNVLLSGEHAVVVDFGIAKAVGDARDVPALTMDGISIGTPVYMSPEQAAGELNVDHRADIYAVGVMLWEMCAGTQPFNGTLQQILGQKLSKAAPSLAPHCPAASPALIRLVARCLAIDPDARPATAAALLAELRVIGTPEARAVSRQTKVMFAGATLAAIAAISMFFVRDRRVRWVRETALPEVQRLIEVDQLDSAFAIATEAAARAPNDSTFERYWIDISERFAFISEPAGAVVTRAALADTTHWIPVATTPAENVRVPNSAWLYRYAKSGYRTVTIIGAHLGGSYVPIPSPVLMQRVTDPDTDMVLLSGQKLTPTLFGLNTIEYNLSNYLMDRLEVTNRQYKAFVDAGGYTKPQYWDSTIVHDGRAISFADAMKLLVDGSGRPGPSTWIGGAPSADQYDVPVGGVSWYEARAYARFAGKEIPTAVEWNSAAMPDAARWVVPNGRFEATGPVRGGDASNVSARGVNDLAGNVREWALNAREPGSRYILGGGWSDPSYLFSELYAQPEFDRSAINGIRLVRRLGAGADLAKASAPIPRLERDYTKLKPVDDATYKGFLALYDYDAKPLNAKVVSSDSTDPDWVREDVTVDSPQAGTRLPLVMFLPKRFKPPYQTVVVWPASDAQIMASPKQLPLWIVDFIVRSGRAVAYPIYEGSLGRPSPQATGLIEQRDKVIRRVNEMRRTIDYATSRSDLDTSRIAYLGASWGGRLGGIAIPVEPRFKAAVLFVAGLSMGPLRPEADPFNFLPHIHVPTLMLSGKYDSTYPYELSQKPFYNAIGTPEPNKKRIVFERGHFLPRPEMVSETLGWLDHYLGPVAKP